MIAEVILQSRRYQSRVKDMEIDVPGRRRSGSEGPGDGRP